MLRAALSLALSAVVVFATASVVVRLVSDEPVPSGASVTGLAWGDRVFTSKREFAEFLAARGVAYEVWAARHPGAAPWQRSSAPGRAAAAEGGRATLRRGSAAGRAVAPVEPAAGKATNGGLRSPPAAATAPASPPDGLASRLAPTALVLAVVMLLLLMARRVGLRPAVVALPAAGPALDGPRGLRPTAAIRPPASTVKAAVAVAIDAPASRAEIVDAPPRDGPAGPGRQLGPRLRAMASAAGASARTGLARARKIRIGVPLAGFAARAGACAARATVAGVGTVRRFFRARSFTAVDAASYSLAVVAAAGIGVLVAFLAGA